MNNILFLGPPGAGKGTQAKILSQYLNIPHLSTGDILRSKINQKDKLGLEVKNIIATGKLVSDDILNSIVNDRLVENSHNGFILDGYPRTLEQSFFLNEMLNKMNINLDYIINIELNYDVLEQRIIKRSKEENREDDNMDVIKTRFMEYTETTKKVSDTYKENSSKIFYNIDGNDEISQITSKIKEIVKNT